MKEEYKLKELPQAVNDLLNYLVEYDYYTLFKIILGTIVIIYLIIACSLCFFSFVTLFILLCDYLDEFSEKDMLNLYKYLFQNFRKVLFYFWTIGLSIIYLSWDIKGYFNILELELFLGLGILLLIVPWSLIMIWEIIIFFPRTFKKLLVKWLNLTPIICPGCNEPNPLSNTFCFSCGVKMI